MLDYLIACNVILQPFSLLLWYFSIRIIFTTLGEIKINFEELIFKKINLLWKLDGIYKQKIFEFHSERFSYN